MGDRQPANCKAKSAASANPKNVTRRIIYLDFRAVRRASQEFDVFKTLGTVDQRGTVHGASVNAVSPKARKTAAKVKKIGENGGESVCVELSQLAETARLGTPLARFGKSRSDDF